ncbi:hypothetical protein GCM10012276_24690 [Nocardioides deserti]|nr:hypothetical protein GCM10012276_24690 [Nocardioides deserti]
MTPRRYTKLGSTGLEGSALTVGCMNGGTRPAGDARRSWARTQPGRSSGPRVEAGITVFDTANV